MVVLLLPLLVAIIISDMILKIVTLMLIDHDAAVIVTSFADVATSFVVAVVLLDAALSCP